MTHYAPLISALISLILTTILIYSKAGKNVQDIPNERSLHTAPVPRVGGVGLMAGVLSGWAIIFKELDWWIVAPLLLLFTVSLIDDIQGLPVRKRLLAHFGAAAILVFGIGIFDQGIFISVLVLLFAVWMINLYNFMDGSDGLAGGMTLFGFTFYGIAALMNHNEVQAMLDFSIGAAAIGFLYHNFHPAKVFMGDAGSIPLGFLVVAMGVLGLRSEAWSYWFPLLIFSPFIMDASITLVKRTLRGAKITEAHREHYYQRAIQMGISHRNVALFEYGLMLGTGISALIALNHDFTFISAIFGMWGMIYAGIIIMLDKKWISFQRRD